MNFCHCSQLLNQSSNWTSRQEKEEKLAVPEPPSPGQHYAQGALLSALASCMVAELANQWPLALSLVISG